MSDSFLKLMTHTQMFEAVSSEWKADGPQSARLARL
jgi:hypothetical protein